MEQQPSRRRPGLGRASVADRHFWPLDLLRSLQRLWREHCRLFLGRGANRPRGGNVSICRRKEELCPRHPGGARWRSAELLLALHSDGLEEHDRGRLWGRAPWCWWSSLQHSGVPLHPGWQHMDASTVLEEEPHAPGYVVHKIAVWRPTVSMTISGVCRYLQYGNYPGQFPYGQGAAVEP
jgi:hypothetical protein